MTHFEKLSFCVGGNLLSSIHIVNVCKKQKVVGFGFFRPTYVEVWFKCISYVSRTGLEPITKRTLNHLTCMAEWLSVRLWTNWLWVRVPLQSLNLKVALVSNKKFLGIQAITLDSLEARMWHDKTRCIPYSRFLYKQHIYNQRARLKLAKNQAKAKQHPVSELLLPKNYLLSSSMLSSKNNRICSKYVWNTSASVLIKLYD